MGAWLSKAALAGTLVWTLVPFAVSQTARFSQAWPADRSALPPDERVRWGTLDNGFRYALLPLDNATGRISMRFAINVGSLRETDDESGFAHLIEHLAFEGAGALSGDDIDQLFRDMGLRLGSDVNGFTTHHYTSYRIELKDGRADTRRRALELFRGFADGVVFRSSNIAKQKAIVLAEKMRYEQPLARFGEMAFGNAMKGTLYPSHPVVGTEKSLSEATREELVAFYRKWYRPELMTLFVVGEFDTERMESEIRSHFSDLASRGRAIPPALGEPLNNQAPRVEVAPIEGVGRTLIDLSRTWNEPRGRDSDRLREKDFLRRFATELLNERCQRFVGTFKSDFIFYDTRFETSYVHARLTSSPDKWITGVRFIDRMIRQAARYGLYADEIELLRDRWKRRLRNDALLLQSQSVSEIADRLESETMSGRVYLSPKNTLERESAFLARLDKRTLDRELKELWRSNGIALSLGGEMPGDLDERAISREFASYRKLSVEPYDFEAPAVVEWSASVGSGRVLSDLPVEKFDKARRIEFKNATKLTFLNTNNEPGIMRALIRLNLPGPQNFPNVNPALRSVALDALFWSGVDGFSWEEIQRELSSRLLDFSYSIESDDSLCIRVRCDPAEFDWFVKMVSAYLRIGGINERGFAFAKSSMLRSLQVERDGTTLAKRGVQRALFPKRPELWDPRFEEGYELSVAGVEAWIAERLANGSIEATVVGDVDKEFVIETLGRSIGGLARTKTAATTRSATELNSPVRGVSRVTYPRELGTGAMVIGNWILEPGPATFKERLSLVFAERILRKRIDESLRETMAISYQTKVDYWSLPAMPELQRFRVEADCLPENLDLVLEALEPTFRSLSEGGLKKEEVDQAREQLKAEYASYAMDNNYLLEHVLFSLSDRPEWIEEWSEVSTGALGGIDVKSVEAVFEDWLRWEEAIVTGVVPEP